MICEYCHTKLDKKWNYCPNCGFLVQKNISLFDYLNQQIKQLTKKMEMESVNFDEIQFPSNITITFTTDHDQPEIKIQNPKNNGLINKQPRKLPKNTVEPETKIRKTGNLIIIEMKLDGVKSIDDIDINIYSNSIEIRAFAKDKGYFKIINIPSNFILVNKEFKNEELHLQFSS